MTGTQKTMTELDKQFRRISICGLCQKTFSNTKLLPCFHSFCLNCLDENTARNSQSDTFDKSHCPRCGADYLLTTQRVTDLPTNEYVDRIIEIALALSPVLHIASFVERADAYDSFSAADGRIDPAYHGHGIDRAGSAACFGHGPKSRAEPGKSYQEDSHRYVSAKIQKFCQTHKRKFDKFCSNCTQVICLVCSEAEHRHHEVISVVSAENELRQMMNSYMDGIKSCNAHYKALNMPFETACDERTRAAAMPRLDSIFPVRTGRFGKMKSPSNSSSRDLVKHRETCLDAWTKYTRRFYDEITTRGRKFIDIRKISKALRQLHDTWRHNYEQEILVQHTQNPYSSCAKINSSSRGYIDSRRELEEREQRIQKSVQERGASIAKEKRLADVTERQIGERSRMKELQLEYGKLKAERDCLANESQITKARSKLTIADKLSKKKIHPTGNVSPNKQTPNESSIIYQMQFVNEQQRLSDQMKEMKEYGAMRQVFCNEKEQLMEEIKMLKSQNYTMHEELGKCKSQLLNKLKEEFEWKHEKELCYDSLKQLKLENEKLKAELMEQRDSNADIQRKLTHQRESSNNSAMKEHAWSVKEKQFADTNKNLEDKLTVLLQKKKRRDRELELLVRWIEQIDELPDSFMTTERHSEDSMIEKLMTSIVRKAKELSESERLMMKRIEELDKWIEESKSRASSELMLLLTKRNNVSKIERAYLLKVKQVIDKIRKMESQIAHLEADLTREQESHRIDQGEIKAELRREDDLTAELIDLKQRLGQCMADKKQEDDTLVRNLTYLAKWIEKEFRKTSEDRMTTEEESENNIVYKIKALIIEKAEELRNQVNQLSRIDEEKNKEITVLRQKLGNFETNQRTLDEEFASERDKLMRNVQFLKNGEKQLLETVQELKSKIRDLQNELKQQRLGYFLKHKDEVSFTQLEFEHLIRWIDSVDKAPTNCRAMEEDSWSHDKQILQDSIEKKATEWSGSKKQLCDRIRELEHQIVELQQQNIAREQQMHRTSLRNSDASLDKGLTGTERILITRGKQFHGEVPASPNETPQQHAVQNRPLEQDTGSRKKLGEVAIQDAMLITEATDLKGQRLNLKNNCNGSPSTAVQITESRKSSVQDLVPSGICNVGNTCYFGATMQNLVQSAVLNEELLLSSLQQSPLNAELLLTNAYVAFITGGYEANRDENFLRMFKEFCKKSSRFANRDQHDSHDLLVNFLNCLRDEERRRMGSVNSPGFRNVLTAVDKVFGGHTITVYVCSTCKTHYHVCEPLLDISLPIIGPTDGKEEEEEDDLFSNHLHNPNMEQQLIRSAVDGDDPTRRAVKVTMKPLGVRSRFKTPPKRIFHRRPLISESTGVITLRQCLEYYSRIERIHDEYLCCRCQSAGRQPMTSALKRTLIYNPPAVLVLHLKRFEQTPVGFKKCNHRVAYDEYLDIGPYCSSSCLRMSEPSDANVWYSLYGVVVHRGSLTAGHYVAYVKVRDCDTRQAETFIQQSFLNRDQVFDEDDVRRINSDKGVDTGRVDWEPAEVEGQWYLADDDYVKAVDKTEVLSQAAYLLFYERMTKSKSTVV